MFNWSDMYDAGRSRYHERLEEAEIDRWAEQAAEASRETGQRRGIRSRVARALIAWGHWMDGRSERTPELT